MSLATRWMRSSVACTRVHDQPDRSARPGRHPARPGQRGGRRARRGPDADGTPVTTRRSRRSVVTWWDGLPAAVHQPGSEVDHACDATAPRSTDRTSWAPPASGLLSVASTARCSAEARPCLPRDVVEALSQPPELRVPIELRAGDEVEVRVELPARRPRARGRIRHAAPRHRARLEDDRDRGRGRVRRPRPTSRWSSSVPRMEPRARATTARRWPCRGGRTSSSSASPRPTQHRGRGQLGDAGADAVGRRRRSGDPGLVPGPGVR